MSFVVKHGVEAGESVQGGNDISEFELDEIGGWELGVESWEEKESIFGVTVNIKTIPGCKDERRHNIQRTIGSFASQRHFLDSKV